MRDPSTAPGHHVFMYRFNASIAGFVELGVAAAGRRFVIPVERAMPVLSGVYERALRAAALSGPEENGAFDELGDRLAELFFALTEEADLAGTGSESTGTEAAPGTGTPPGTDFVPPADLRLI
jgi:hypothetical protein